MADLRGVSLNALLIDDLGGYLNDPLFLFFLRVNLDHRLHCAVDEIENRSMVVLFGHLDFCHFNFGGQIKLNLLVEVLV